MKPVALEQSSGDECIAALVARQIGRPPREPWRVQSWCPYGHPSVLASPSTLDDGSRFPTLYWLTCPWLRESVGTQESDGAADAWADRLLADPRLAAELVRTDGELRRLRGEESGGIDTCADVGLAGQQDPLGVKCVHAHVALALAGLSDPIGEETLAQVGYPCDDERCSSLRDPRQEVGP